MRYLQIAITLLIIGMAGISWAQPRRASIPFDTRQSDGSAPADGMAVVYEAASKKWVAATIAGGGAPTTAHYLTNQAEAGLSAEVNLGALTSGLLKHTVAAGVSTPATATAGVDYSVPISNAPADHVASGSQVTETAGETMAIGDVCYMGPDGKMWKAKGILPSAWVADTVYEIGSLVKPTTYTGGTGANFFFCSANAGDKKSHATTEPTWAGMVIGDTVVDDQVTWTCVDYNSIGGFAMAAAVISADATGAFILAGYLRDDSWSALVKGQPIYLSRTTAGAFTQIKPTTTGDLPQRLGRCASATTKTILFDPKVITEVQ